MPKKPYTIRFGDKIKIITPEFFVRCGYELDINEVTDEFIKERGKEIDQFINIFLNEISAFQLGEASHAAKRIAKELAYEKIRRNRFGGAIRKIFRERREELTGKEYFVEHIKYHKTGEYFPPSSGYDSYTEEYDFVPGGLKNEKTTKVLYLNEYEVTDGGFGFYYPVETMLKIEATYVKKINN